MAFLTDKPKRVPKILIPRLGPRTIISVSAGADSQTDLTRGLVSSEAESCTEFEGETSEI